MMCILSSLLLYSSICSHGSLSLVHNQEELEEYRKTLKVELDRVNSQLGKIFHIMGTPSEEELCDLDEVTANLIRDSKHREGTVSILNHSGSFMYDSST